MQDNTKSFSEGDAVKWENVSHVMFGTIRGKVVGLPNLDEEWWIVERTFGFPTWEAMKIPSPVLNDIEYQEYRAYSKKYSCIALPASKLELIEEN